MKTADIRRVFLDYFAARGHAVLPGSSLVPDRDPTLLFTNSGMVQFKDIFLGRETPAVPRAATAQRCVRAGGKHNDLENVGYTARHHTFFEMLGNFSFGDYFKTDAIRFAWQLLTEEFGLPPQKLWVTVFEDDDEAEKIWLQDIGVDKSRFSRIGAADNFWSMGDTGPCGPCSEIFYDHGPEVPGGPPGSAEQEGDRFVEIWNLVFMQFNRAVDGKLTKLPKPSVDTGMGLERIAAVLQGARNNFDIDLFQNLIHASAKLLNVENREEKSLRVIADHIRAAAFLIADGVTPSNEGRGYALRRIIRRAIRHGYQLGGRAPQQEPFMHKLVRPLRDAMGAAYPQLAEQETTIARVLQKENEKFAETLEHGLRLLDKEIAGVRGAILPGEVAFKLYDTFGFPADLTADVAREHNLRVDLPGFDRAMAAQRKRARAASRFQSAAADELKIDLNAADLRATEFCGYEKLDEEVAVVELFVDGEPATDRALQPGQRGIAILNRTPFYATGGGQVGDRGEIIFDRKGAGVGGAKQIRFRVEDTKYVAAKVIAHIGVADGEIRAGDRGVAKVDAELRQACARNHSATHLLHRALKIQLGGHVRQKGSLVEAERLRFDFSHNESLTAAQLTDIERRVNMHIRANQPTECKVMDLQAAKDAGAESLFGEKYDARVRTIRLGESFELCGGTHVARSGDIGGFKITAESGVAAGIRRIEAVTAQAAEDWIARRMQLLTTAAALLKTAPAQVPERLRALLEDRQGLRNKIGMLRAKIVAVDIAAEQFEIAGGRAAAVRQDDSDAAAMRRTADQWKQKLGSGVVLVAGVNNDKVILVAGVTADLTARYHAGELIQTIAPLVGGRGGGKPEFAQGGGNKTAAIDEAFAAMKKWLATVG